MNDEEKPYKGHLDMWGREGLEMNSVRNVKMKDEEDLKVRSRDLVPVDIGILHKIPSSFPYDSLSH